MLLEGMCVNENESKVALASKFFHFRVYHVDFTTILPFFTFFFNFFLFLNQKYTLLQLLTKYYHCFSKNK